MSSIPFYAGSQYASTLQTLLSSSLSFLSSVEQPAEQLNKSAPVTIPACQYSSPAFNLNDN